MLYVLITIYCTSIYSYSISSYIIIMLFDVHNHPIFTLDSYSSYTSLYICLKITSSRHLSSRICYIPTIWRLIHGQGCLVRLLTKNHCHIRHQSIKRVHIVPIPYPSILPLFGAIVRVPDICPFYNLSGWIDPL